MTKRLTALIGALVILLMFFTACGNGSTQTGGKPQANDPQLVIAANPVFVYDDGTTAIAYNDMNKAMTADSGSATLTAITDSDWAWAYERVEGTWPDRAVYGFGRWKSGAGAQAKSVYAYAYNEAGSVSLGVYNTKNHELVTYQGEAVPDVGVLLSAVAGEEEALLYTVPQDGVLTIPAGTFTAIEQVAGVKTGFLAEDGTARSASVRILVNSAQVYSGTLCNATAAADGAAVTQLSYPQIDGLPVKAGDTVLIGLKLDAAANSDEDVTEPTVDEDKNWQVVRKSTQVLKDNTKGDSDVTASDGSIPMVADYQFTFTVVRDKEHETMGMDFINMLMRRTGCEIFGDQGDDVTDYEIVLGHMDARPTSQEIYKEITTARADNVDDYIIRLVGTKIYIVGANDEALQAAMDYFIETFVKNDSGRIPAKYNYYHKPAHVMYTVAGQNIAGYTIRVERYPSYVVTRAAEAIQAAVRENCGYVLPIKNMNLAGTDLGNNEIRVGPMNGAVKVERQLDTRFDNTNWQQYMTIGAAGMLDADHGYYQIGISGKNVAVEGGSDYAVSVAAMKLIADLKAKGTLAASYTASGTYTSAYDYATDAGYDAVKFDMADGFGLVYAEEFDYTGTEAEKEKAVRKKWNIDDDDATYQQRDGIYGDTWWVAADTTGNNYLIETTKKRIGDGYRFDSVRLSTGGQWGFRYGIWETRIVGATRKGACSAVWSNTGAPYSTSAQWGEIDVYENYGQDMFVPMLHAFTGSQYWGAGQHCGRQTKGWCIPQEEGEHLWDTFHTMAVVWTYDYLDIYFDGQLTTHSALGTNSDYYTAFRTGQNIKLANGIGTVFNSQVGTYCAYKSPWEGYAHDVPRGMEYWWGSLENMSNFFEAQVVDYTRVYQTSNDNIEFINAENEIRFSKKFIKNNS